MNKFALDARCCPRPIRQKFGATCAMKKPKVDPAQRRVRSVGECLSLFPWPFPQWKSWSSEYPRLQHQLRRRRLAACEVNRPTRTRLGPDGSEESDGGRRTRPSSTEGIPGLWITLHNMSCDSSVRPEALMRSLPLWILDKEARHTCLNSRNWVPGSLSR